MLYSNHWLLACSKLKQVGDNNFEPGDRIARGFADLGYEEYLLLANDNLLSLYTATKSTLHPAHREHFFRVLEAEDLSKFLISKDLNFTIENQDGKYSCKIQNIDFTGNSINEVLLKAVEHVTNS